MRYAGREDAGVLCIPEYRRRWRNRVVDLSHVMLLADESGSSRRWAKGWAAVHACAADARSVRIRSSRRARRRRRCRNQMTVVVDAAKDASAQAA